MISKERNAHINWRGTTIGNANQPTGDMGTGADEFVNWANCYSSGYWWNFALNRCEVEEH